MRHNKLALGSVLVTGLVATVVMQAVNPERLKSSSAEDHNSVAALDQQYQLAVKNNDAAQMAQILADDFVLVTGAGKSYTKADMLEDARRGDSYEQNDEEFQTVRVWGDTAVVTAQLWEKGTSKGKSFDHKFWFSDTYVRTPRGWKYVFGQSSLPLPASAQ